VVRALKPAVSALMPAQFFFRNFIASTALDKL
jgi:hypothetical protein